MEVGRTDKTKSSSTKSTTVKFRRSASLAVEDAAFRTVRILVAPSKILVTLSISTLLKVQFHTPSVECRGIVKHEIHANQKISQHDISLLKEVAPLNVLSNVSTLATFHPEISALKAIAYVNIISKDVAEDTSHEETSLLNEFAPENVPMYTCVCAAHQENINEKIRSSSYYRGRGGDERKYP